MTLTFTNMTAVEYCDATNNVQRVDVSMNIPNVGYGEIQQYLDYNTNVLTQYIPMIDFCQKFRVPFNISLPQIFSEIQDPTSGLLEYLGEVTMPWSGMQA